MGPLERRTFRLLDFGGSRRCHREARGSLEASQCRQGRGGREQSEHFRLTSDAYKREADLHKPRRPGRSGSAYIKLCTQRARRFGEYEDICVLSGSCAPQPRAHKNGVLHRSRHFVRAMPVVSCIHRPGGATQESGLTREPLVLMCRLWGDYGRRAGLRGPYHNGDKRELREPAHKQAVIIGA